eukprot:2094512-Alexandrium_andersonii.AAC.1
MWRASAALPLKKGFPGGPNCLSVNPRPSWESFFPVRASSARYHERSSESISRKASACCVPQTPAFRRRRSAVPMKRAVTPRSTTWSTSRRMDEGSPQPGTWPHGVKNCTREVLAMRKNTKVVVWVGCSCELA